MQIEENISLQPFNTFGIDASAKFFAKIDNVEALNNLVNASIYQENNSMILGGGSNILLTRNFDGLVIKNELKGISKIKENDTHVWLEVQAGEVWHDLVLYSIKNGWGGIENLSLIPGCVGASPMQNIGAYGVELKDVFESLEAYDLAKHQIDVFDKESCQFGYRESIFKKEMKGRYLITSVTVKLSKNPQINVSYGAIENTLEANGVENPSIKDVSDAVIQIRQSKLPNPKEIGNAGSFFKNPVITKEKYNLVKAKYPNMPSYPVSDTMVKIPAGWLIDQAGWKGKRIEDYGVHKNQALVLVNYGNANGKDIEQLAYQIKDDIFDKYEIEINPEVNIV
ncbi:MAG: UDP-N-acetylmuramate dehydrogenase [Chitinophagales bacterium]